MVVVAFFLIPVFWQINNYFGSDAKPYTKTNPFGTPLDPTNEFMITCNQQNPTTPDPIPDSTPWLNT